MAFIYSIKDTYRAAVEAATGGKNTVMYDDQGNPSIMVVIPKFYLDDVITGAPHTAHPAFIVNGVEKPYIYISKYQNIVQNSRAYSLPGQDPANSLTFDQALSYCYAKGQGWHLMSRAEWAAIALWCKKNNFMPRGNNNYGSDAAAAYEHGRETYNDGTHTCRIATGSGPASWSHDGTPDGIYDLNGNVAEWNSGMRLNNGEIQVIQDNNAAILNADHSATSTLWKAIASADGSLVAPGTAGTLKYDNTSAGNTNATATDIGGDPQLNSVINNVMYTPGGQYDYGYSNCNLESLTAAAGVTAPTLLKALGLFPVDASCGGDGIWVRNYAERFPYSGGDWSSGAGAGVFALNLSNYRYGSHYAVGFRSAYVL
jgi:sulfatase modifying factor 1